MQDPRSHTRAKTHHRISPHQTLTTMNRLFGSKAAKPKPTLTDAIASTETRADGVEVKIRKLDAELTRYRDQMRKMRDGPGKNAIQQRALRVLNKNVSTKTNSHSSNNNRTTWNRPP